jgi:hypothetical protein
MRLLPIAMVLVLPFAGGCLFQGDRTGKGLSPTENTTSATDEADIKADIAELSKGRNPKVAEDSVAYDEARQRLQDRGSIVERHLWEAMKTSPDWGVRMGCVEVLQSVGTRASVDPLIAILDDPEWLVAFHANVCLEQMFKRKEIPAAGAAAGSNGLPPLPAITYDAELDERGRAEWHAANRQKLRQAWTDWWAVARDTAVIDPTIRKERGDVPAKPSPVLPPKS